MSGPVKQIVKHTLEGLKSQVKHTAEGLKTSSVNIIKESLGNKGSKLNNETNQVNAKQAVDQQRLARVRQQMQYLAQVDADRKRREQEEEEADAVEAREGRLEEQQEIVQLKRSEEKKESLAVKNVKFRRGTKESGPRKRF